jgi:hypothetical protein
LLSQLPSVPLTGVQTALIALEAKAAFTEFGKAKPRLYDELNTSHLTIHGDSGPAGEGPDRCKAPEPRHRDALGWAMARRGQAWMSIARAHVASVRRSAKVVGHGWARRAHPCHNPCPRRPKKKGLTEAKPLI